MKIKRFFTKNFTEENMRNFGRILKLQDKDHLFSSHYNHVFLGDETFISYNTGNEYIDFTDFDIISAYEKFEMVDLSLDQVELLKSTWVKFVYNNQKTISDKKAYREAYHKYVDKTIFNKKTATQKNKDDEHSL